MNKNQKEFKKAVEGLQAKAKELEEIEGLEGFGKLFHGIVNKNVAALTEDYLWGE